MKKLLIQTIILGAFSMPAIASANEHAHGDTDAQIKATVEKTLPEIDTDGNGTVSPEEHEAYSKKKFEEADTNKDGTLNKDEMVACMKKHMEDMHKGTEAAE